MVEHRGIQESLRVRLDELQGISKVRERAALAALENVAKKLDRGDFQIVTGLLEHSRLLERSATDAEWLDALSTYVSPEILLGVWDKKNELTRERIEEEQKSAEDQV